MNTFLIVLFIVIVIIILLLICYFYFYNKINDTIIRVNQAENRIDSNLRDKYDLLSRSFTLFKNKIEVDENITKELAKLKTRKLSNFELDRTLTQIHDKYLAIYEEHKELRESDEIYKANKQMELIDEELVTLRNYYNGNIASYNKMIKKFPTLFIAMIKKYQVRNFYDMKDMNDTDYEDFKL